MLLSANRKQKPKEKSEDENNKFSFTPSIDSKSKAMAESKYRSAMKDMSHHELLLAQGNDYQRKREQLSNSLLNTKMKNCTFQPNVHQDLYENSQEGNQSSMQRSRSNSKHMRIDSPK